LPIWGAIPDQRLGATGDREFALCILLSLHCPLSKIAGFYIGCEIS
jgi:hypothetical protein